jgi:hypothetical protein
MHNKRIPFDQSIWTLLNTWPCHFSTRLLEQKVMAWQRYLCAAMAAVADSVRQHVRWHVFNVFHDWLLQFYCTSSSQKHHLIYGDTIRHLTRNLVHIHSPWMPVVLILCTLWARETDLHCQSNPIFGGSF